MSALQTSAPVNAASNLAFNPVSDLAKDPVTKLLNKLDSYDPPKGVPGPEVKGQFRKWRMPAITCTNAGTGNSSATCMAT